MRGQRVRFYPTAGQRRLVKRCFEQVQMVYNQALHQFEIAYREERKLTFNQISAGWTAFKRADGSWDDVPSTVATQTLRHLQSGFSRFFANVKQGVSPAGYPTPKGRFWTPSASFQIDPRLKSNLEFWAAGTLQLPGFGPCKVRGLRPDGSMPKTIALSRDGAGRYWLSFNHEAELSAMAAPVEERVGIDLGIARFATLSDGTIIENPRHLQRSLKQLRREQRALSRCQPKSNRREKRRRRVAQIHARVAAQRQDFLQKTSTTLVRRYRIIGVEDLNVRGMGRNRRLARHIADAGLGEFVRLLEYKSTWYGRSVLKCGRWDPTSQVCSACGGRSEQRLSLSARTWTCEGCGIRHDRDLNAAHNVLRYALGIERGVEGSHHPDVSGSPVKRVLPKRHAKTVRTTVAA